MLCPQLGGLALLLCVGVETFSKIGRYWFRMHENSSGGMGFRYGWISVLHDSFPDTHLPISRPVTWPHSLGGILGRAVTLSCSFALS